jgi:hypothetical protein
MGANIVRAFGAHRMHAIIIARKYAKTLRDGWASFDFIQDHWLTRESPRRRFYAAEPFLCFQRANVSSLLGHHVPDRGGSEWGQPGSAIYRFWNPDAGRQKKTYPLKCGGSKRFIDVGEKDAFNGAAIDTPLGRLCVVRGNARGTLKYIWTNDRRDSAPPIQLPISCNDDPRLIWHGGKLLMSTNFWWGAWEGNRIELREITIDKDRRVTLRELVKFTPDRMWPGYVAPTHEKNWAPFSREGKLLYVYSISPHRILEVDLKSGRASIAAETLTASCQWGLSGMSEMRGNAPPVRLADGSYLSTFHVRDEKASYYTGFYRFAGEMPFEVLSMSREPVLWPEDSDGECWRSGPAWKLIFVQSMDIVGDVIRLTGGDNDHSVMEAVLPKKMVLEGLRPLGTSTLGWTD